MVSLQIPFLQLNHHQTNTILDSEGNSNSKKRKWDHHTHTHDILLSNNHWMSSTPKTLAATTTTTTATNSFFDVNLHLETPLPSEWQRCLDIQSGEIHFYNTRTKKRTMRDPRKSEEPLSPRNHDHHMSLDLQLNLPCGSLNQKTSSPKKSQLTSTPKLNKCSSSPPSRTSTNSLLKCLTSKTLEDDDGEEAMVEMVAVACMRCHMLVMLQKSSPTCPNCKFIHPPYQNTTAAAAAATVELFNPKLSLSC